MVGHCLIKYGTKIACLNPGHQLLLKYLSHSSSEANRPNLYLCFSYWSWQSGNSVIFARDKLGTLAWWEMVVQSLLVFIIHDLRGEHYLHWNMAPEVSPKGLTSEASFFILQGVCSPPKKAGKGEKCLGRCFFLTSFFWWDGEPHNIIQHKSALPRANPCINIFLCCETPCCHTFKSDKQFRGDIHKSFSENGDNWKQQKYSSKRQQTWIKPVTIIGTSVVYDFVYWCNLCGAQSLVG